MLPFEELVKTDNEQSNELLTQCQKKLREFNAQLMAIKDEQENEIEKRLKKHITSLMINDINLNDSDKIRKTLESQTQHNDILTKKIQKLEQQLTLEKVNHVKSLKSLRKTFKNELNIVTVDHGLDENYGKYSKALKDKKDGQSLKEIINTFEDLKTEAFDRIADRINKICSSHNEVLVVLFIERYLSKYDKFVENYRTSYDGIILLVRLPLYSRIELKLFRKKIDKKCYVEIYIPQCDNEAVKNAQRKFFAQDIPDIERKSADDIPQMPLLKDGFDKITICSVQQGD